MAKQDLLTFAYFSLFIGLFIGGMMTLMTGGLAMLDDGGSESWDTIQDMLSTRSELATVSEFLGDNFTNADPDRSALYDLVLGIVNVALFVYKLGALITLILLNYLTLTVWLTNSGTIGAISSIVVFIWQFWTFYCVSKFAFKDRLGN